MESWYRIGRSRQLFALATVVLAAVVVVLTRTWSSALLGCALLLLAWDMAFVSAPPFGAKMSEVYRACRLHGWHTPVSHKLLVLLAMLLLIGSIVLQLRGR